MEPSEKSRTSRRRVGLLAALLTIAVAGSVWAVNPKEPESYLDHKAFSKPELYISSSQEPVEEVISQLPNKKAWDDYQKARQNKSKEKVKAFVDPRSGTATNLMPTEPLLPGRGVGNEVTLEELGAKIGKRLTKLDAVAVGDAVLAFVRDYKDILAVDLDQLGGIRTTQIHDTLWQISIPQAYKGVPVRHGRLVVSINNGNVVVAGTETWANVKGLSVNAKLTADAALAAGFGYAGGGSALDEMIRHPTLEIIPVTAKEHEKSGRFEGPMGAGYKHRLVWTFAFRRPPDEATWEVIVDAHDGEVLSFQDINHYAQHSVTGGVYPITSTESCPSPQQCGMMQSRWPMPFADTGLAAPNDFTNSAGIFDWTSGTTTTTLTGRFVDIVDTCGAVSNSSTTGSIGLGGRNGQHDCTTGSGGGGNTPASRTAFYEVNKVAEMGRGWLPNNAWLKRRLTTKVNLTETTCNAFWNGSSIDFYRSGGGCRNTGEIAGILDHEWGHGLDANDVGGVLSNSSEAYADIAAIYRLQTSCVGHGFLDTSGISNRGCGRTADGTGFNANESQVVAAHCNLDCSGVRDADYLKHNPNTPDTALGFVCTSCAVDTGNPGPCGRQVHCAAAPSRQAAWDLVARDLQQAPFNLDSQTAFLVGNKLFYQGSGNIGAWHSCTCGSSSSGCGATNGYMQWLMADDDNGDLSDGTPHMTAIFNAFNRHGIACATPAPVNSGCSGGPTAAPGLAGTAGDFQSSLVWRPVAGATRYWVFRSEGHAGCNFGKTRIAETTGLSYTDTQVAAGRDYYYNVVAAGSSSACFGRASDCVTVTPAGSTATPDFNISCSPSSLTVAQGSSTASLCTVSSASGFASAVTLACANLPPGMTCSFNPNPVTPPADGNVNSTLLISASPTAATGSFSFQVQGTSDEATHSTTGLLLVTAAAKAQKLTLTYETTPKKLALAMGVAESDLASSSLSNSLVGKALVTGRLGRYFPTEGDSFAILSTGRARQSAAPNRTGSRTTVLGGTNNSKGWDMVRLSLTLNRPAAAQCLSFDFAFYSEEFPEGAGLPAYPYNDTFTAESGGTSLTIAGNQVTAPRNFAFLPSGQPVSATTADLQPNTLTTYDGGTQLMRALTPVSGQQVELVFTIQDIGDSKFDSSVFLDNVRWLEETCPAGTVAGSGSDHSDEDSDGLLDSWEQVGIDLDGDGTIDLDLPAMGAAPRRKDIFIEIDSMVQPGLCVFGSCTHGHSHQPNAAALQRIIEAFRNAPVKNPDGSTGINLHIDAGPGSVMDPVAGTTWGSRSRSDLLDHETFLGELVNGEYDWTRFDQIKAAKFSAARRFAFHYTVFGHFLGNSDRSGISELDGDDFVLTLGAFSGERGTTVQQAGTLMHELGHNLGLLDRGGNEDLSVMNSFFQTRGVRRDGDDGHIDYSLGDWGFIAFEPVEPQDPEEGTEDEEEEATHDPAGITRTEDDRIPTAFAVEVAGPSLIAQLAGTSQLYEFQVKNAGENADTYSVAATSSLGWAQVGSFPVDVAVGAGQSANVSILVDVPAGTPANTADTLTLTATSKESPLMEDSATTLPYVPENPPVAHAGPDQQLECSSQNGTPVTLDGAGSHVPTVGALAYQWTGPFPEGGGKVYGSNPTVTLPLGVSKITLRVNDGSVDSYPDEVVVTVVDTTPPVISAVLSPVALWPPDHTLRNIAATVQATDICSIPTVALSSAASSEPDDAPGGGDGNTRNDIQGAAFGTADFAFLLRSERSGSGPGRIYTIRYTATDSSGNQAHDVDTVKVPHNQKK
jgi:trimeric autotransporter adhesin